VSPDSAVGYRDLPEFLADLKRGGHGRAPLAQLVQSLRNFPAHNPTALAIVAPLVAPYPSAQDAGLLLAGLWSTYHLAYTAPVGGRGSLGTALRRLEPDERDRHLSRLTARGAGQARALRRAAAPAITALAKVDVRFDWAVLHEDLDWILRGYPNPTQRRWLTDALSPRTAQPKPNDKDL
jgi:hypothetical protein